MAKKDLFPSCGVCLPPQGMEKVPGQLHVAITATGRVMYFSSLQLFNELALREGFVVSSLSCDGFNNALNHPQRFLPSLLSTLEIPMRSTYGYTDLLYDVLSDVQLSIRLRELVSLYLDNSSTLAIEVRGYLDQIIQITGRNETNHSDLWAECVPFVTHHLTGDSIRDLSASPANRRTAYLLLGLARDLLVELGTKGLAITVDEEQTAQA